MAWQWTYTGTPDDSVNLSPATGSVSMYILKQALKQAGWTVLASSDGTTYNSSGDQITHGGSGGGGMANSKAWFRIRTPEGSGGREFTFQRDLSSDLSWRFKLSHSSGFATGGSATVTPSATDEVVYRGGGTDASPTFYSFFSNQSFKIHVGVNNTAPYNAYMVCVNDGGAAGTNIRTWWFINMTEDSHSPLDIAPYVVRASSIGATTAMAGDSTEGCGSSWIKKGMEGERFLVVRAGLIAAQSNTYRAFPGDVGRDIYDNSDVLIQIPCYRSIANDTLAGWKGWLPSDMICWPASARAKGDYTDIGLRRYAYWDEIALIFPQSVIPSVTY